jgi:hypothetical protein
MGLNFIFSDSLARIDACSALPGMGNGEALRTAAIAELSNNESPLLLITLTWVTTPELATVTSNSQLKPL